MTDRRHRWTHICPQCGHKFKNFKWKRSCGGPAASCPKCGTFAYDWAKIKEAKDVKCG